MVITFANIYALNIGTPKYIKHMLTDPKSLLIDSNTTIRGDFNSPLTIVDRYPDRKSIRKHQP